MTTTQTGALVSGPIGVNINTVVAGTTTDGEGAPFNLGTIVAGPSGDEFMLVQAGAALTTVTGNPLAICIDENFQAQLLTKALVLAGHKVGWCPQIVIADNAFFWARIRGVFDIRVGASCAADITLYTTATAGRLDDTSGGATANSQVPVAGVVIVTAASASTSIGNTVRQAIVTWPIVTVGV